MIIKEIFQKIAPVSELLWALWFWDVLWALSPNPPGEWPTPEKDVAHKAKSEKGEEGFLLSSRRNLRRSLCDKTQQGGNPGWENKETVTIKQPDNKSYRAQ